MDSSTKSPVHSPPPQKPLILTVLASFWWILETQWWVVKEHSEGLEKCKKAGSITATLVSIWAPVMCFPQWVIAPLFGFKFETMAIFGARVMAMCIVRRLDGIMPLTRALGLCHLLTFGPIFSVMMTSPRTICENVYFDWFVWFETGVIGLCLFLDARDFFLHLAGYPYPCYIREGVLGGQLQIDDPRAKQEVTWRSRLLGP